MTTSPAECPTHYVPTPCQHCETDRPKTTPADELRAAAFQLRNPFHLPGLNIPVDTDLASVLADWLDAEATGPLSDLHSDQCVERGCTIGAALAVARQINTGGGS